MCCDTTICLQLQTHMHMQLNTSVNNTHKLTHKSAEHHLQQTDQCRDTGRTSDTYTEVNMISDKTTKDKRFSEAPQMFDLLKHQRSERKYSTWRFLSSWANPSHNKLIFRENILTCQSRKRTGGTCNTKAGSIPLSDPVSHVSESALAHLNGMQLLQIPSVLHAYVCRV